MYRRIFDQHGGVVRTPVLHAAGLSRYRLSRAIEAGHLERICVGWVARPGADTDLIFAAQNRLTLSCVTQATRLGLWVRSASQQHFAVPRPGSENRPTGAALHYRRPVVPRERFALTDAIENVLMHVAHCQPHEEAVATWDSALNKKLVDRRMLDRLALRGAARAVLADTSPFADSGLESYVRQRLRWLKVAITAQSWILGHRVDLLIGDRLVLQVDGGHHVGVQRTADIGHDALLRLHGYTVIRVGYDQVVNRWHEVQEIVMQAIGQGLHLEA